MGALDGRTVVVTGGSDGIGKTVVRECVEAGASVIIVSRNEAKTAAAANAIMSATGRRAITWEIADLSRVDAVKDVAERLLDRSPKIDVLVNNAGAVYHKRQLTAEGFERTFALNHLAYFTLTLLLLERLNASASSENPSRIINVASRAHMDAQFDMNNLQMERGYSAWRAYTNSKLCNVLFTRALARRVDRSRIMVHAMHPGLVASRFAANNGWPGRLVRWAMDRRALSLEEGADTVVWLAHAAEPLHTTGEYWVKRAIAISSNASKDIALAEALWQRSANLAGLDADTLVANARATNTIVAPTSAQPHASARS